MKLKLQLTSWQSLFLLFVLAFAQNLKAQCTDETIRPSDGFTAVGWAPRCNNGNDGEIRITGISSTAGSANFANRGYAVRILSGPGGPQSFPIEGNVGNFNVTGLQAGAYIIDIIDQCGGNSADMAVTLHNPSPNIPVAATTLFLRDRLTANVVQECGNTVKYKINVLSTGTTGNVAYTFTNNLGNTLSVSKAIDRVAVPVWKTFTVDIEIPLAFFNNNDISYTGSNLCGPLTGGILEKPAENDIIYGMPRIKDVSDPADECNLGYDIKVFREFMTNPVTVTVEETAHPGTVPLNFAGDPITPRTINITHTNAAPIGMGTQIDLGLKYNTHYTITFTGACGLSVTKSSIEYTSSFDPGFGCSAASTLPDPAGYFENVALLVYNSVAISSKAVGPLTVTVNSGPQHYTTAVGNGNTITSARIQYPYSTTLSSPFLDTPIIKDNVRTFPPGLYNFTVTDACGKTATLSYNAECNRSFEITHTSQTCGAVSENISIQLKISRALFGTRATIYKADGSIAITGIIGHGAPFNFVPSTTYGTITVNLSNNTEYFFRYGGVTTVGSITEPTQFGGVGALPRLTGGYLYEYNFRAELQPFRFASIEACGSTVSMTATGGVAPYTFSLLNANGTTQLFPNQTEATFSGLLTGTTYTAKATDNCGREFSQQFQVYPFPVPFIASVNHPGCSNAGSVTIANLPTEWTITQTPGGNTYSGTGNSFSITGLSGGNYTFSIKDNFTLCRDNEALNVTILERPNCPIATDDVAVYNTGESFSVNVLANDITGQLVNPGTVSLVPAANSSNLITDGGGDIISMTIMGEGTWIIDPVTGQASFNPEPGFTGTPSSVEYNVEDFYGNTSNNAVIKTDILPIAVNDTSVYTGTRIVVQIVSNDTEGDRINPATVSMMIPETPAGVTLTNGCINRLTIPNEGVWQVNRVTGAASFTPETGFTGVPSPQRYTVRDFEGNLSNIAVITLTQACHFNVSCPTFEPVTVTCHNELPTATQLTISEFEALGNSDGRIANSYCGIIEIKAENSPYTGCNSEITRTYTITEFQDANLNGRRDSGENTIINSVTCLQSIRIEDRIAPVFSGELPANIAVECSNIPPVATLTATDNCETAVVTFSEVKADGTCANDYTITRTWTATDACGNSRVHSQVINVQDNTPPVFTGVLPADVTIECNSEAPLPARITATDLCGTAEIAFSQEVINGSCSGSADIIRTWTATDECGNQSSHTQTISVRDTTAPTFLGQMPEETISADCTKIPAAPVMTAIDNCSQATLTYEETEVEGDCKSKYQLLRKYIATDACGNIATFTQTVNLTCQIQIYNAVSPDGDGRNDIFYLEGIECFPNNSVEIFNRWGAKVFETQGYDNTTKVFRGKSEGKNTVSANEELPAGTYFYVLKYDYNIDGNDHENIEKAGYLYIANK